jgi:ABC-type transporter Mla subunit MlaD
MKQINVSIKEQCQLLDSLNARIHLVEKLIKSFQSMVLVAEYVKERESLMQLKNKLQSL